MTTESSITIRFGGDLREQDWPAMERVIKRGFENPQLYVSRSIVALSVGLTLVAAFVRSPAWPVLGGISAIALVAWRRSPRGRSILRSLPAERLIQEGVINRAGVVFVREDGKWEIPWSRFTGFLIDEAGIVLYLQDSLIAIPRLSVGSSEDWSSVIELVRATLTPRRIANPFLDVGTALALWISLLCAGLAGTLWLVGWWR
jgi:hypothetical protein